MIFSITMKTPDAVNDAIERALSYECVTEQDEEEKEVLRSELNTLCSQWFDYGECLTLNVDSEAKTITVRKA